MKVTVADYLAKRIESLGITDVFGLPGDYNFNVLDAIIKNKKLNWINGTNELNAGYAADGYARIRGYGAVVTTYGVGELSAVNAVAGAYAENVPVIKIVGVPSTSLIQKKAVIHHNFQNPDYYAFEKIFSNITETTVYLNKENAKDEIDRAFETIIKTKKPVYIAVPADVCYVEIEDVIPNFVLKSDKNNLKNAVSRIKELFEKSKKPLFLLDYPVKRNKAEVNLEKLIQKTKTLYSTMVMGKGAISENNPYFIGMNLGNLRGEEFLNLYNNFDLIISFGVLFADFNTANFYVKKDDRYKIDIESDYTIVEGVKYENVLMNDLILEMIQILSPKNESVHIDIKSYKETNESNDPIRVDDIFPYIQENLKENDLLVVETGIMSVSASLIKLPADAKYLSQTLWGSIGWATPAFFGAAMADKSKRPILLTGEGSHQLTAQETANMFKYNIRPIIVLLNNSGYTIERMLSPNPYDLYNDITEWNYSKFPEVFSNNFYITQVRTPNELKTALEKAQNEQKNKFCCIEIFTDKLDIPVNSKIAVENGRKYKKSL